MSEENHVKEYKNKVKILKQKELIIAFNNANPDRAKSKAEREQDEYFEAKKKALKEYFDSMVAQIELESGIELTRYINASKSEKKIVIQRFIKQHGIALEKDKVKYTKMYKNAYRLLNRDHINTWLRQYYKENKEYFKEYYKENKEYLKACAKKYYLNNKEKIDEYNKQYCKQYNVQYYKENKERRNLQNKEWVENNKEKRKEYQKQWYEKKKALKLQQQLILDNGSDK